MRCSSPAASTSKASDSTESMRLRAYRERARKVIRKLSSGGKMTPGAS